MDPYVRVLLVEQEPDTISLISLLLSEIKECRLEISLSGEEALLKIPDFDPDLVLFAHGLFGKNGREVIAEIRRDHSSVYLIVSLPVSSNPEVNEFMMAGANDCVLKDKNYVPNLVLAAKKALIRIAERREFSLPPLNRAEQIAMDENLPDIVFKLDKSGKILYANRVITDILGFDQKEIVAKSFADLVVGVESRRRFEDYVARVESQTGFRGLIWVKGKSGLEQDFQINCSLEENGIYGVLRQADLVESSDDPFRSRDRVDGVPPVIEEMPLRIGPYRIITLLGAGSMGRVYQGFDEQLERFVAIKILSTGRISDKDYFDRFHREAKLLASITHPNIALIYYFGSLEGLPYFCMEYMAGGSLENMLQQKTVFDPEAALSYTMQVAIGLNKALEKGVVHLDIKPSNLMLAEGDRVKIVDFGLARTSRELERISTNIVGTPLYIAPEQIQGGLADFRSDVYSLGMTFFEMLYGFVPHSGKTLPEIFRSRLHEELPARETLSQDVPVQLYDIAFRMTSIDPAKRPASYSDLIEDLELARRSMLQKEVVVEIPAPPQGSSVYMRGLLYDRSFAEILGEIARKDLSGKLTLSWIDLHKTIHFKSGNIIAVLSNQEGESFLDLLLQQHQLTGEKARRIQGDSSDLFLGYSSAMQEVSHDVREKMSGEMQDLAWRILQGLFSWVVGEYFFELGEFSAQGSLQISAGEALVRAVKSWVDYGTVQRRFLGGSCRIDLNDDFQNLLSHIKIAPADAFMLFRFEKRILFRELFDLSGISEEEFFRLIYLFVCVGIVDIHPVAATKPPARKLPKPEYVAPKAPEPAVPSPLPPAPRPQLQESATRDPLPRDVTEPLQTGRPREDLGLYYYQCAVKSSEEKNYWAAVEYCRKALTYRQEVRIYRLMGVALATHPAFRHEAMDAYKKALEIDPGNLATEREIAELYFLTGNFALARSRYQAVLDRNPHDERAIRRLEEIQKKKK